MGPTQRPVPGSRAVSEGERSPVTAAQRLRLVLALGVVNLVLAAVALGIGISGLNTTPSTAGGPTPGIAFASPTPGATTPSATEPPGRPRPRPPADRPTRRTDPPPPDPSRRRRSSTPTPTPSVEPTPADALRRTDPTPTTPPATPAPTRTPVRAPVVAVAHPDTGRSPKKPVVTSPTVPRRLGPSTSRRPSSRHEAAPLAPVGKPPAPT